MEYIKCPYNNVCDKSPPRCDLFCPLSLCRCKFIKHTGHCRVLWIDYDVHLMAKEFKEKLYEPI